MLFNSPLIRSVSGLIYWALLTPNRLNSIPSRLNREWIWTTLLSGRLEEHKWLLKRFISCNLIKIYLAQTRMGMFSSQGSGRFCSKYDPNYTFLVVPSLCILEIYSHIQSIRKTAISWVQRKSMFLISTQPSVAAETIISSRESVSTCHLILKEQRNGKNYSKSLL